MAAWGLSQGISLGHYLAPLTAFISKAADWGVGGECYLSMVISHCFRVFLVVGLFTP